MNIRINREQRLFVLPCGDGGFSCLGFDVCEERIRGLATELEEKPQPHRRGTRRAYETYERLIELARKRNQSTGWRSQSELTPQLMGLEEKRVEIVGCWEQKRRFYVGKSAGFIPVHLEIARRDSSGGPAVMGTPFRSLRIVNGTRM